MITLPSSDASRRDTTLQKVLYLQQLPVGAEPGRRGWIHRAMRLQVAESRAQRALVAEIVKRRHGLGCWPARPRTLILSYLATLEGVAGPAGAGGCVLVALLPGQYHVTRALGLHQCEVLTLARMWRADDLTPSVAPDFTPEVLRRIVRGERSRGPLLGIREEWIARKCREGGLRAAPRLLATYADPAQGHDGATYRAAGALPCGPGAGGKLLFAWGLDPEIRAQLSQLSQATIERSQSC
jgi:hypothetical protein